MYNKMQHKPNCHIVFFVARSIVEEIFKILI